jgi:hypothetical protein
MRRMTIPVFSAHNDFEGKKTSVEGRKAVFNVLSAGFASLDNVMELLRWCGHRAAFFCCRLPHRDR